MFSKIKIQKLVFSGLFLAIALVLPLLTGQIPEIGKMLSPMHLPVLLCGFVCGAPWGFAVGVISPLLRSLIFGMPPLFPMATAMAVELAAYGLFAGVLYKLFPKKIPYLYISLVLAMLLGRIFYGGIMFLFAGLSLTSFSFAVLWSGTVVQAIPGIILQIVLIPPIVMLVRKRK